EPLQFERSRSAAISTAGASPGSLAQAAEWLVDAANPLILTAYSGRNPQAVAALVRLAETLGAPVVESRHRLNFPSNHPLHFGFSHSGLLEQADCILIIDSDVPWVPVLGEPAPGCRIIQIDIDPLKIDIPIWGFPVDLAIHADSAPAMVELADAI